MFLVASTGGYGKPKKALTAGLLIATVPSLLTIDPAQCRAAYRRGFGAHEGIGRRKLTAAYAGAL